MKLSHSNKGMIVEMTIHEDATLPEVFYQFSNFLRSCGYIIPYDKDLDLVDNEEDL